jgi:hypothetical protein
MPSKAAPSDPERALASLADLMAQSEVLGRHNSQMSAVRGWYPLIDCQKLIPLENLSSKTVLLEELRSEKRILLAERQDAIQRLIGIQNDLEDVSAMEEKLTAECQTLEDDLHRKMETTEYIQARGTSYLL